MKQKITTQGKLHSEEDVREKINKHVLYCALIVLCTLICTGILSYINQFDVYVMIRNFILAVIGSFSIVFAIMKGILTDSLYFDNGKHIERFFYIYLTGLFCAAIFVQLPENGWMFLFFYITLSLLSNPLTGMVSATTLLLITIVNVGNTSAMIFAMYLFAGLIGIALFSDIDEGFKTEIPILVSLLMQLVCIFANSVLFENKQMNLESVVIPGANIVVNTIMLFIMLQIYNQNIVLKEKNLYQTITDPEFEYMAKLKMNAPKEYYHSVHTAYLTERICAELGLDVMAAKCAAYYYRSKLIGQMDFPEKTNSIIIQLQGKKEHIQDKEASVVMICDHVITTLQYIADQNRNKETAIDYERIINSLLEKRRDSGAFDYSNLTIRELHQIHKKLLEEKMYYDFLR